jgi:hypothetical protein
VGYDSKSIVLVLLLQAQSDAWIELLKVWRSRRRLLDGMFVLCEFAMLKLLVVEPERVE